MRTFLILLAFSGVAAGQDVWTLRHAAPVQPAAAAGFPGLYLLMSYTSGSQEGLYKGFISTNGLTWSETSLPLSNVLITANGEIVGAGGNGVWRTTDGISFSKVILGDDRQQISGLAFGNNCLIAVDESGGIYRASRPSGPWLPQLSPADSLYGVAYGAGKFTAFAWESFLVSQDGITWTVVPGQSWLRNILGFSDDAVFGVGGFFRSTDAGPISTSARLRAAGSGWLAGSLGQSISICKIADAHNPAKWLSKPPGFTGEVTVIGFCGDIWVAGSASGKISTSQTVGFPALSAPPVVIMPSVVLSWPSVSGRRYQVQGSSDNQQWADIGLPLNGNGSALKFSAPADSTKQFYRVNIQ